MISRTDILDSNGNIVASLVWEGSLYEGRAFFEQGTATPEQARAIENIIDMNRYLKRVTFNSIGSREKVNGWSGVEGMVGALRLALPAIGLHAGRFDPIDGMSVEDKRNV